MQCSKHKNYRGLRRPRKNNKCKFCLEIYNINKSKKTVEKQLVVIPEEIENSIRKRGRPRKEEAVIYKPEEIKDCQNEMALLLREWKLGCSMWDCMSNETKPKNVTTMVAEILDLKFPEIRHILNRAYSSWKDQRRPPSEPMEIDKIVELIEQEFKKEL